MGLTLLKAGEMGRARRGIIHDKWERREGSGDVYGQWLGRIWQGRARQDKMECRSRHLLKGREVKGREGAAI